MLGQRFKFIHHQQRQTTVFISFRKNKNCHKFAAENCESHTFTCRCSALRPGFLVHHRLSKYCFISSGELHTTVSPLADSSRAFFILVRRAGVTALLLLSTGCIFAPAASIASMTLRARPSPGGRSCRFQNRLVAPCDADGVDLNGQFHNIDVFVG